MTKIRKGRTDFYPIEEINILNLENGISNRINHWKGFKSKFEKFEFTKSNIQLTTTSNDIQIDPEIEKLFPITKNQAKKLKITKITKEIQEMNNREKKIRKLFFKK